MQTILKYDAYLADDMLIEMPAGAQLLSVQSQNERPQLWALVDRSRPPVKRRLFFKVTGEPISELPGTYLATVLLFQDALVLHYFDGGEVA